MQMVGFFARRIVLVSGGGSGPSALSRAVTLQNRAVEAAQAPANSKSRRFLGIGTSSKSRLTIALRGAERWADGALRVDPASDEDTTAAAYRIGPTLLEITPQRSHSEMSSRAKAANAATETVRV